jgi:endonuclease III
MKTLDRLDHEEARQALALFSQMEAAAKGRDVDAILAASTNMVAETILRGCDSRKEAERIADVAEKLSETIARYWSRSRQSLESSAQVRSR